VSIILHICKSDSTFSVVSVPINPFALVSELLSRECCFNHDAFWPMIVNGKLVSILLVPECVLSSYGDLGETKWCNNGVQVRKPGL
jgi:hypothetical protein